MVLDVEDDKMKALLAVVLSGKCNDSIKASYNYSLTRA